MNPITVLLIDDNASFLDITTRFLQINGNNEFAAIGTANDGKEAIRKTQELRPEIILVDLAMPDMSGLDVIECIRAEQPELGIIALTVMDTESYRQAAVANGADDFVAKSAMNRELLPTIRKVAQSIRLREKHEK